MILYRYEDALQAVGGLNEFEEWEPYYYYRRLLCREYEVKKETPKGYWIENQTGYRRWMCKGASRKFAWGTKEEALRDYLRRKTYQIKKIQENLQTLESVKKKAEEELKDLELKEKIQGVTANE